MYESITMNVMELELCFLMTHHADKCNSSAIQIQYKAKSKTFHSSGDFQKQFRVGGSDDYFFLEKLLWPWGRHPVR